MLRRTRAYSHSSITLKVRKCKVQRVCVLHFQLAGWGGCGFFRKLYHCPPIRFAPKTALMLRLAFCTVLSDIPASAAAFTMSSLASSFPSASSSSISLSACSVLVALCHPRRTAARRRLYHIRLSTKSLFPGQGKRLWAFPPAQGKICRE